MHNSKLCRYALKSDDSCRCESVTATTSKEQLSCSADVNIDFAHGAETGLLQLRAAPQASLEAHLLVHDV